MRIELSALLPRVWRPEQDTEGVDAHRVSVAAAIGHGMPPRTIRRQEPIRRPIARARGWLERAGRVKGGKPAEPGEGTLDAPEHSSRIRAAMAD
jgi:hypothetical protein